MNELSGMTASNHLMSKPRASMTEAIKNNPCVEPSLEFKELQKLEIKMEQINHAFDLVKEIRCSLESALKELSSDQ